MLRFWYLYTAFCEKVLTDLKGHTNHKMMLSKKQWYNEYKEDLIILYKKIMYVLKNRNLVYKDHSFHSFCDLIYSKTDHILYTV